MKDGVFGGRSERERRARRKGGNPQGLNSQKKSAAEPLDDTSSLRRSPKERKTAENARFGRPKSENYFEPPSVTRTRRKRRDKEGDASTSPQVLPLLPRLGAFSSPESPGHMEENIADAAEEFLAAPLAAAEAAAESLESALAQQQDDKTSEMDLPGHSRRTERRAAAPEVLDSSPASSGFYSTENTAARQQTPATAPTQEKQPTAVQQQEHQEEQQKKGGGGRRGPRFPPSLLTGFSEPLPTFPEISPASGDPEKPGGNRPTPKTVIFDSELRGLLLTALYDVLLFVFVVFCWLRLRKFRGDYICGSYEKKAASRDAARLAVAAAAAAAPGATSEERGERRADHRAARDGNREADRTAHQPIELGSVASARRPGDVAAPAATTGLRSAAAVVESAEDAVEKAAAAAAHRDAAVAAPVGGSKGDEEAKRAAVAAEAAARHADVAAGSTHEVALAAMEEGEVGGEAGDAAGQARRDTGEGDASPAAACCCLKRPVLRGSWKKYSPVRVCRAAAREVSSGATTLCQVYRHLNTPLALAHTRSCTGRTRVGLKRRRFWRMRAKRITAAAGEAATRAAAAAGDAAAAARDAAAAVASGSARTSAAGVRATSRGREATHRLAASDVVAGRTRDRAGSSRGTLVRQQQQGATEEKPQGLSDEAEATEGGAEKKKRSGEALRPAEEADRDAGQLLRRERFSLSSISTIAPQRSEIKQREPGGGGGKEGGGARAAAAGRKEADSSRGEGEEAEEEAAAAAEAAAAVTAEGKVGKGPPGKAKLSSDDAQGQEKTEWRERQGEVTEEEEKKKSEAHATRRSEPETKEEQRKERQKEKRRTPSTEELRMAAAWAMADIDIESLRGDMACYFHFLNTLLWCCKVLTFAGLVVLTPMYLLTAAQPSEGRDFLTLLDRFSAADKIASHALWMMFVGCWIFSGVVYYAVYDLWHRLDDIRTRPAVLLALLRASHSLRSMREAAAASRQDAVVGRNEGLALQLVERSRSSSTRPGTSDKLPLGAPSASSFSSSATAALVNSSAAAAAPAASPAAGAALPPPAAAPLGTAEVEAGRARRRAAAAREEPTNIYRPSTSNRLKMYPPLVAAAAGEDDGPAGVREVTAFEEGADRPDLIAAEEDTAEENETAAQEEEAEETAEGREGEEGEVRTTSSVGVSSRAAAAAASSSAAAVPPHRAGEEGEGGGGRPAAPLSAVGTTAGIYERLLDGEEAEVMAPPQYYSVILSRLDRRVTNREEFAESFVEIHQRFCSVCCPSSSKWRGVLLRQLRTATAAAAAGDGDRDATGRRSSSRSSRGPVSLESLRSRRGGDAETRSNSFCRRFSPSSSPRRAAATATSATWAAVEGKTGASAWGGGRRRREAFGAAAADGGSPSLLLRRSSSASSRLWSERSGRPAAGAGGGDAAAAEEEEEAVPRRDGDAAAARAAAETEEQLFLSGAEECEEKLARRHTLDVGLAESTSCSSSSSLCVPGFSPDSTCTCVLNVLLVLHAGKGSCLYNGFAGQQAQEEEGEEANRNDIHNTSGAGRRFALPASSRGDGAASAAPESAAAEAASPNSSTRPLLGDPTAAGGGAADVEETDAAAQEEKNEGISPELPQAEEVAAETNEEKIKRRRAMQLFRRHGADGDASQQQQRRGGGGGRAPSHNSGVAIVTFDNRICVREVLRYAHRYRRVSKAFRGTEEGRTSALASFSGMAVSAAAPPADIQWDNLHLSTWNRGLRVILLNAVLVALCLTIISPVVLLSQISQITGSIDARWKEHRIGFLTLTAWLPPLILLVVNSYVQPLLVAYVAYGSGFWLKSQEAAYVVHGNITFQLLNTLIIPLLSLSSIESVLRLMYTNELTTWSVLLGYSLVHSSGGFAMRYLVNLSFLGAANELLQLYSVVAAKVDAYFFHLKERKKYPFDLGYAYAQTLSVFTLLLVFSVVVPLLLPLGLLYLCCRRFVDKYNYVYHVHTPLPFESDGRLVTIAMKYMLSAVSFLQFAMAGFFCAQKQSTFLVIAGSFTLFVSLVSWISLCSFTIPPPGSAAGREAAWQREHHSRDVQIFLPRQRRELRDAYKQPCGKAAKCDCNKY